MTKQHADKVKYYVEGGWASYYLTKGTQVCNCQLWFCKDKGRKTHEVVLNQLELFHKQGWIFSRTAGRHFCRQSGDLLWLSLLFLASEVLKYFFQVTKMP